MAYFSDTFMGHRRNQWLRSIHAVEVQVGAAWHRGTINQKRISDAGLRGLYDLGVPSH